MKSQDNEPEQDPFLCTCGPCKRFYKESFGDAASNLKTPPSVRALASSGIAANKDKLLHYGDRVLVDSKKPGIVRHVGFLDDQAISPKLYVGVKLDDNVNSVHNGIYHGKRYFYCPRGHGTMVKFNRITMMKKPVDRPPLDGNKMFPSYDEVTKRRKERKKKLEALYAKSASGSHRPAADPNSKPPRITPKYSKSFYLRIGVTPQKTHLNDPDDIAVKDSQEEKVKRQIQKQETETSDVRQMRKWKQEFGGDEQAERMAETLKRLHLAYKEGLQLTKHRHSGYFSDESTEDERHL
ncbi:uncharacterized protein LOC121388884 [Gigantopelta aegis]|uniref:uncharacterized protein LOC121388884 n=1 Tax=Gigantopelta aegis TaxID=1735272 RepID=UPI001B8892FB|nr:uncharacterized protein LOC121388884 [Gigantopelta aegis]